MYEYFQELEYGVDDYLDEEHEEDEEEAREARTGDTRKIRAVQMSRKQSKLLGHYDSPVLWMPTAKAYSLEYLDPINTKPLPSYALLPEWREKLTKTDNLPTSLTMNTRLQQDGEMRKGEDEAEGEGEGEGDWEDDDEEDDEEDDEDDANIAPDPQVMERLLAERLAGSGFGGEDQGALLQAVMQMMSGGGDDALTTVTEQLLNRVSEEGAGSSTTQWLSQKGVSLMEAEEGDISSVEETTDGPAAHAASTKKPRTDDESPKDSVAEPDTTKFDNISTKDSTPVSGTRASARVAGKKRRNVTFAPPNDEDENDSAVPDRQTQKRLKQDNDQVKPTTGKLKSVKSKTKPVTAKVNEPRSSNVGTKSAEVMPETEKITGETKDNRKRKAATALSDGGTGIEQPKRQLRNFAAPTASSQRKVSETLPKKTTRSKN